MNGKIARNSTAGYDEKPEKRSKREGEKRLFARLCRKNCHGKKKKQEKQKENEGDAVFRATKNAEHFFERKQKGANNKTTNLIGKYLIKRKRAQEGKRWKGNKFYWKISVVTVIAQNLSETVVQWGV